MMKKLLSVISIVLLILVIGSVSSLATELNTTDDGNEAESGTVQIGSSNTNKAKNSTNTNKVSKNTNVTADNEVETNVVGSTNSNKTNTNTNKTSNTSQYNSTTNSSKLPYAGTGTTSIALVAIAFVGSAVYAYKKVSDYNI